MLLKNLKRYLKIDFFVTPAISPSVYATFGEPFKNSACWRQPVLLPWSATQKVMGFYRNS